MARSTRRRAPHAPAASDRRGRCSRAVRAAGRGRENVPGDGPVIVVADHVGIIDGPLAAALVPRPAHFLVKRSFFAGPIGRLLHGVGQIPITQRSSDRQALTVARGVLVSGGVVGIFPECTRGDGAVEAVHGGAAYLALATGATIVPLRLSGTAGRTRGRLPRLRSRIDVTFGEPFDLSSLPAVTASTGRMRVNAASDELRRRLAAHVSAAAASA